MRFASVSLWSILPTSGTAQRSWRKHGVWLDERSRTSTSPQMVWTTKSSRRHPRSHRLLAVLSKEGRTTLRQSPVSISSPIQHARLQDLHRLRALPGRVQTREQEPAKAVTSDLFPSHQRALRRQRMLPEVDPTLDHPAARLSVLPSLG